MIFGVKLQPILVVNKVIKEMFKKLSIVILYITVMGALMNLCIWLLNASDTLINLSAVLVLLAGIWITERFSKYIKRIFPNT